MTAPRYFLTGATGLVGSHLARHLLAAGHPVAALRRARSRLDLLGDVAGRIEWIEGDLLDVPLLVDCCAKAEVVVHAAAVVSFQPRDAEAMRRANVDGTANVVNACLAGGVKKMCHISSVAALGKPGPDGFISEKSVWDAEFATSYYAETKYLAEREVWRGGAEGLEVVVVNPSVVLGEGLPDGSTGPLFGYVAGGGRYYPPGLVNVVDVLDVARAVHLLCQSPVAGERFVLNAANLPYRDFFGQIAAALGKPAPAKLLSPGWAKVLPMLAKLGGWLTGQPPKLTSEVLRASMQQHRYQTQKVERALDFRFAQAEQTIARVAQWYQDKF
jgi:nucleoside-diphosphate-sugar epimerase